MTALTDHRLTEDELHMSQNLNRDILKYAKKNNSSNEINAHWKPKDVLIQRKRAKVFDLAPEDYPFIIRMLVELGVIFFTSLQDST